MRNKNKLILSPPPWRNDLVPGYSEPNAGSDLASLQTKGELVGDEWVINGQKIWTSTAQYSQMCFVLLEQNQMHQNTLE